MKHFGGIPAVAAVRAIEILDSRGNPTVKCSVKLVSGNVGVACVPSGASTGVHEAHELRDGDKKRYGGKGVLCAVANVNNVIASALIKSGVSGQAAVDKFLCEVNGTPNKSKLGANAILAVSLAYAQACAAYFKLPLYAYLGGAAASYRKMPSPMMNVINGGAHASNNIDIQEFMIVPYGTKTFAEALRCGAEIYHTLGKLIKKRGKSTAVGDEGGYAPELGSDEDALMLLVEAIHEAGYDEKIVKIALDVASSEWKIKDGYRLPKRDVFYTTDELIAHWQELCEKYPIMSIEDGVGEDDFEGWAKLTSALGDKIMLVGDDFFATQADRVRLGIELGCANALLVKPNQVGTLSETIKAIKTATSAGYNFILSHRSGETEDSIIADIAVAMGAGFIKSGAPCRSERVAKYNRLLEIEAAF